MYVMSLLSCKNTNLIGYSVFLVLKVVSQPIHLQLYKQS